MSSFPPSNVGYNPYPSYPQSGYGYPNPAGYNPYGGGYPQGGYGYPAGAGYGTPAGYPSANSGYGAPAGYGNPQGFGGYSQTSSAGGASGGINPMLTANNFLSGGSNPQSPGSGVGTMPSIGDPLFYYTAAGSAFTFQNLMNMVNGSGYIVRNPGPTPITLGIPNYLLGLPFFGDMGLLGQYSGMNTPIINRSNFGGGGGYPLF